MSREAAIGFIGLGNMGTPMARNLARQRHSLWLYDANPEALTRLALEAPLVQAAGSLAELGANCATVITMLPDAEVVRRVILGPNAAADSLAADSLVIDMSSSAPLATRALGQELESRKIGLIDAPVSGGVPRARDASLTIMAGGEAALIDRAEPLLSVLGSVIRTGPLGSGHAMKALNNYVSAAGLLATCEALIVAEKFGLDPKTLNDVLKASTGRNNTTDKKVEPFLLTRAFNSGFALELMRKDVGMAASLAGDLDLTAPWLQACRDLLNQAAEALPDGADHTEAFAYLERRLSE